MRSVVDMYRLTIRNIRWTLFGHPKLPDRNRDYEYRNTSQELGNHLKYEAIYGKAKKKPTVELDMPHFE